MARIIAMVLGLVGTVAGFGECSRSVKANDQPIRRLRRP